MSKGINRVQLLGHLGKDAEVKFTPSGIQVAQFSLATTGGYKDKQTNEWKETTEWHRCVCWRCERLVEYLKKGKQVLIDGRLQTRSYDDKEGVKRYLTEVVFDGGDVVLLGGGDGSRSAPRGSAAPQTDPGGQGVTDDDVPF